MAGALLGVLFGESVPVRKLEIVASSKKRERLGPRKGHRAPIKPLSQNEEVVKLRFSLLRKINAARASSDP